MIVWREIRRSGEFLRHLPKIWQREQDMPAWYQASSWLWTPTFESYVRWAVDAQEVYGLFEGDVFMGCVYLEKQDTPKIAVIHFSAVRQIDPAVFIAKCAELRNTLFHRGIKYIRGWTLRKNFALRRLMTGIGFRPTSFVFDQGSCRGRVMRWELYELARG